MTKPEDYLEGGAFQEDQRQLKRTQEIVEEASRLFGSVVKNDEWPYELEDGRQVSERKNQEHKYYSQSTNAMILFSLVAAARKTVSECPLVPNISRGKPIDLQDCWATFERVWQKLAKETEVEYKNKKAKHVTYSESFGREDPFTLTWILEIDRSYAFNNNLMPQKVRKAIWGLAYKRIEEIFNADDFFYSKDRKVYSWLTWENKSRKKADKQNGQSKIRASIDHAFPALRHVQLYRCLKDERIIKSPLPTIKLQSYFENRIHEQLSKSEIRDGAFDASELVFALEGLLQLEPDSVSRALLDRIFAVIAESQNRNPYWRPVKPIVTSPQGHVLFPLSVETACSLLRCCQLVEKHHKDQQSFSLNIDLFRRYTEWLLSRIKRGKVISPNVEFTGWHSEHVHIHPGIHLWETSQVMLFLIYYSSMLDRHIARRSLEAINLFEEQPWNEKQKYWHIEYWEKEKKIGEPLAGLDGSPLQAYAHALRHLVAPWPSPQVKTKGVYDSKALINNKKGKKQYSLLLYGPPGTGKTAFAEEICKALRWPLITITPSDFIRGGESEVEARAKRIFEVLEAQSEVVILFDEIDRMILDRESAQYTEQSDIFQFMTPSMLTKLRNLRKKKRVIFLIATNYAERIDKAAKRRGRIDAHLLLPPPDNAGRLKILKQLITKEMKERKLESSITKKANKKIVQVAKETKLMTFGELKGIVDFAIEGSKGGETKKLNEAVDNIAEKLMQWQENVDPASISIRSYQSRFEGPEDSPKPFREFLVLLYLRLEDGEKLQKEEKDLTNEVLKALPGVKDEKDFDKIEEAIQKEFPQDTKIVEVIINALKIKKT
jgi:adenylate kinase family enzyme